MDVPLDVVLAGSFVVLGGAYALGWYVDEKADKKEEEFVNPYISDEDFYSPELPEKEGNPERLDL